MRVGVVVEIERSVRRRELVCAECRNDLVVRPPLAVWNTGDDVCAIGFGISGVVDTRGVVHHTQFDCRYRVNGGVVAETHAFNFEVSAVTGKVVYFIALLASGVIEFQTSLIPFERNGESSVAYLRGVHAVVIDSHICHFVSFGTPVTY